MKKSSRGESCVAPHLGLKYPSNPWLAYRYPPLEQSKQDVAVLTRILVSLLKVPSFYIQVLHLMNKMNLPCPLVPGIETIESMGQEAIRMESLVSTVMNVMHKGPVYLDIKRPTKGSYKRKTKQEDDTLATDESEWEWEEPPAEKRIKIDHHQLQKSDKNVNSDQQQQQKSDKDVNSDQQQQQQPQVKSDKHETVSTFQVKEPQVKIDKQEGASSSQVKEPCEQIIDKSDKQEIVSTSPPLTSGRVQLIPIDTLLSQRLSLQELSTNKLFQNVMPLLDETMARSCTLYIKNLHPKKITLTDVVSIFGNFIEEKEQESVDQLAERMSVRLMEGRMKGQAFVTFETLQQAQKALKTTNGFVLYGKPMVVEYGKK